MPVATLTSGKGIRIHPNPVRTSLFVALPKALPAADGLRLYSPSGQLLRTIPIPPSGGATIPIDLSSLPPGLYILRVASQAYTIVRQ